MLQKYLFIGLFFFSLSISAQKLPVELKFSEAGKRLVAGSGSTDGFFQLNKIRRIDLEFDQPDYWAQLTTNYSSKKDIPARIIYDGKIYHDVGVRFKGQTSYQRVTSMKKSFNITMDYQDSTQNLKGYETINLNNSFEDNSFIREVLYENLTRPFTPSLKANYAHLYINGQDWGLYPCVQALDGDYTDEWFLSNEGARWRAERTTSAGGGGGGFGAGTSSLNYLGDDPNLYLAHYTLKKTSIDNHWTRLAQLTKVLNTVPMEQLEDSLNKFMDVDRTLWFLAKEIMFGDDDSYINKGGMDYYLMYQKDIDRFFPLEYDANSVMKGMTSSWSIFLKESDVKFPLASRLFKVPALRQRYLAHFRTMFNQALDSSYFINSCNSLYQMIDTIVQSDPKKLMTYTSWQNERNVLINWMRSRRSFILNNTEFKQVGVGIDFLNFKTNGVLDERPGSGESPVVELQANNPAGMETANLYYGLGYDGAFSKVQMKDDGLRDDLVAGDGIYTASIPPFPQSSFVRYYVETIAKNASKTAVYLPEGAEHDVFIYQVKVDASVNSDIVINELMASNTQSVADQDGEYDDWIEIYNKSNATVDLSGWVITDNPTNLDKYRIPQGTKLGSNGYLMVWADENGKQEGYHANFKLSAAGEELFLLDSSGRQVDYVKFGPQETDKAYARNPNGTGNFVIQQHTFNQSNNLTAVSESDRILDFKIFPNPAWDQCNIVCEGDRYFEYQLFNQMGLLLMSGWSVGVVELNLAHLPAGIYLIRVDGKVKRLVIQR